MLTSLELEASIAFTQAILFSFTAVCSCSSAAVGEGTAAAGAPTEEAAAPSATIEGINAISSAFRVKHPCTQPSLPQPVKGGLSSADSTEYSIWRLEAIHHLPSRRIIALPEAALGSPILM